MVIKGKYYLELYQSPSTNELEVMVHESKHRALKSRDKHTINIIEVDIDELKHTHDVVGQSEQLKAFNCINFEDGHGICETQCDYCKRVKGF